MTGFPELKPFTCDFISAAANRGSQHNHEVITDVAIGWSKICLIGLNGRLYVPAGSEVIQARLGKFLNVSYAQLLLVQIHFGPAFSYVQF